MARHLQSVASSNTVLRISIIETSSETATLQLDGQVSGKWVECLQTTCEFQMEKGSVITIDLKNVSFADRDGIALLRGLWECGVEVLNAAAFLAEQIRKSAPS